LLRHHQIVGLRSIDPFLALNGPYTILRAWNVTRSNIADGADSTNSCWHVLLTVLLDGSWSVGIFSRHFRAITLESDHAAADTHDCLILVGEIRRRAVLSNLTSIQIVLSLISKSSPHHGLHSMSNVSTHNNVVFLYHCDAIAVRILLVLHLLRSSVVLLGLNDVPT
jgi:hypothetical protein